MDNYLDNLKEEIKSRYKGEIVNTIFIGGGTPSSLNEEELVKLFNITSNFSVLYNNNILKKTSEFLFFPINILQGGNVKM